MVQRKNFNCFLLMIILIIYGFTVEIQFYLHFYHYIVAHYDSLAQQIWHQCDGKIDAIIVGAGTGGSIAGIARKIKTYSPNTAIVAADPYGSILSIPANLNIESPPNKVQGIGYDFIPRTCMRQSIDHWVKTDDKPSFTLARSLIRKEGLLVGGSSGAVLFAAFDFIKSKGWQNDSTKRVVCVFSDSVRNYLTKFLSKEWCIQNKFIPYEQLTSKDHQFHGVPIKQLNLSSIEVHQDLTIGQAKQLFQKGAKIIPIKKGQSIKSVILPKKFLELVLLKKLNLQDSALKIKTDDFAIIPDSLDVAQLSKILQRHEAVLVQRRDVEDKLQKLWVSSAVDIMNLMK